MTLPQYKRCECSINGRRQRLSPQETELLALLLVADPDQWTSTGTLIEALWPDPDLEPEWALKCVHVVAGRLRTTFGVPIVSRVGRACGGYRIPREARAELRLAA
jgi:DNA-binding response OmpR family regulator